MLKNRILLLFVGLICFFAACKNDPPYDLAAQAVIDDQLITKYIADSGLTMEKGAKGLYYHIEDQGTGIQPGAADSVTLRYVGKLVSTGVVFDSTAVTIDSLLTRFPLTSVIEGWQLGVPLIREGGKIHLIVPSGLAYQNRAVGTILGSSPATPVPANSNLDFEIKLISVTRDTTNHQ